MIKRIFSTLVLWLIVFVCFFVIGPDGAVWLLAALAFGAQFELYQLLEKMGRRPFKKLGVALGLAMILLPYYAHKSGIPAEKTQTAIIALTVILCCLGALRKQESRERMDPIGSTLLGLAFIPFMYSFLVRMIELPEAPERGLMLVVWLIVTAKFTDVGALLIGKALGRHPMSPVTSPNKTWEGAIGGCLVSVGLGFALVSLASDLFPAFFTPLWGAVLALPIAVAAILSDLVESAFKRTAGEKDSGSFIPGIGGAFDLTDSFVLAAPTGYLLFQLLV